MAIMQVSGAELAYDDAGSGPVVVLIHAGCADRRMWKHQFRWLSERHRVIRYDWRGYGGSSDATGEYAHHDDLLALLDELGVDRTVLIGASDGGKIALDVTLTVPGRVSGLVLIAAGLSGHVWPASMMERYRQRVHSVIGLERLRRYRAGEMAAIDSVDLDAYSQAETEYLVAGPGRTRADLDPAVWDLALAMDRRLNERSWTSAPGQPRTLQPPAAGRLHEVAVPTLVITGDADVPEILAVSDLLVAGIDGTRRITLPETGHLPPLERPAEVTAAVMEFLSSLATPVAEKASSPAPTP